MCVTFCHVNRFLYLNHEDCSPDMCHLAGGKNFPSCDTCKHYLLERNLCQLTMGVRTNKNGCCHYNVTPVTEAVSLPDKIYVIYPDMIYREPALLHLQYQNIAYIEAYGQIIIDPGDTISPETFGVGTSHE